MRFALNMAMPESGFLGVPCGVNTIPWPVPESATVKRRSSAAPLSPPTPLLFEPKLAG